MIGAIYLIYSIVTTLEKLTSINSKLYLTKKKQGNSNTSTNRLLNHPPPIRKGVMKIKMKE
jgi:hypothetical protein